MSYKKIQDLGNLEWDDTINNFVLGKNIQIVHKSLENKLPQEKMYNHWVYK
jgi:hypothetical protein